MREWDDTPGNLFSLIRMANQNCHHSTRTCLVSGQTWGLRDLGLNEAMETATWLKLRASFKIGLKGRMNQPRAGAEGRRPGFRRDSTVRALTDHKRPLATLQAAEIAAY